MENGYHLYDFKGTQLREEHIERFKQWLWRPRPPTLLNKEEQKQVRKNLREYSKMFEDQDQNEADTANQAVVETRRRLLNEWLEWRKGIEGELREGREERGLPETIDEQIAEMQGQDGEEEEDAVVEEIVEEIVEETEEIVA
jgi:translation initiation factor 3 subunit B